MEGDPEFVILKPTVWLPAPEYENKILGSVIRYPLKPLDDFVPSSPLRYNTSPLHEGEICDFLLENKTSQGTDVSAGLQSITGFSFKGNTEEAVRLSGKIIRHRRLTQHSKFWENLRQDPEVAKEVPPWISLLNTWPPCLVVGIMIATSLDIEISHSVSNERGATVEVPLTSVALAAAGVPLPPGLAPEVGNPTTTTSTTKELSSSLKAAVPGEKIFALELRIVTTAHLRHRQLRLREKGPRFRPARKAYDDDDYISSEGEQSTPLVEDLVLKSFTQREYRQMGTTSSD